MGLSTIEAIPARQALRRWGTEPQFWLILALLTCAAIGGILFWIPEGTTQSPAAHNLAHFNTPFVIAEIAMIFLAASHGFSLHRALRSVPAWMLPAVGLWTLVAVYSAVSLSTYTGYSVVRTALWFIHIAFGFALAYLFRSASDTALMRVLLAVAGGALVYTPVLIVYVASVQDPMGIDWVNSMPGFNNVRNMGFLYAAAYAVALGIAAMPSFGTWTKPRQAMLWISAALIVAVLFWSGTRGGLLAAIIAVIITAVAARRLSRKRVTLVLLTTLLAGGIASTIHTPPDPMFGILRFGTRISADMDRLTSNRTAIWRGTIQAIERSPTFGYGEGQLQFEVPEAQNTFVHPHNVVLQMLFAWGFVGGLPALGLIAVLWIRITKTLRSVGDVRLPSYLLLNTLIGYSFIDGTMFHPLPLMLIAITSAICLAWDPARRKMVSPAGFGPATY